MEHVHLALYKRKGTANARKKEIRAFTGWTFEGDRKVSNVAATSRHCRPLCCLLHRPLDRRMLRMCYCALPTR